MRVHRIERIAGLLLCLTLCTGSLEGCGTPGKVSSGPAGGKITLRLSDSQTAGYVTIAMDNRFAREVSDRTGGRIQIAVVPNGRLGDEKSVCEQVQYGAVDACRVSVSILSDFNRDIGVMTLPYLFSSTGQMFRVLDGQVGDTLLRNLEADSRFVGLAWTDAGARSFYTTHKQIRTPDDLRGLKIRVQQSNAMMEFIDCFHASPVQIGQNDIYSALQSGVVDAAENNWSSFVDMNHEKICRYFTVDEHMRIPEMIVFSQMSWDRLSGFDQKTIRACAKDAAMWERKEWLLDEEAAEKKAEAGGTVVTKIWDKAAWRKAVQPMYTKHPEWLGLVRQIQAVK